MKNYQLPKFACSSIFLMLISTANVYAGFTPVAATDWNEGSVRKVLQTFAYGGLARESQIAAWKDSNFYWILTPTILSTINVSFLFVIDRIARYQKCRR